MPQHPPALMQQVGLAGPRAGVATQFPGDANLLAKDYARWLLIQWLTPKK